MGFLAPAIPLISSVGGSILGGLFGKKAQNNAMKRSPEEQTALTGAQGAATGLATQGQDLIKAGMPGVNGATNYWQTLLGGNRAAMSQAVAAPTAAITDQYRGAERGLERSGVRGGIADLAKAELSRDRVGKISGLTTGVQPAAAEHLGELGTNLIGAGTRSSAASGDLWSNLLHEGFQNRMKGQETGAKTGGGIGSLIFDLLNGVLGKVGGKAKLPGSTVGLPGPIPGMPTFPPM